MLSAIAIRCACGTGLRGLDADTGFCVLRRTPSAAIFFIFAPMKLSLAVDIATIEGTYSAT